jgi:sigma-54-specific transcriptional regulator
MDRDLVIPPPGCREKQKTSCSRIHGRAISGNWKNTVHHALVVCPGTDIRPADLRLPTARTLFPVKAEQPDGALAAFKPVLENLFGEETPHLYQQIDAAIFRAAYDYCEQNQLKTARLLGLSRNIVRDRLIRYGMIHASKVTA